MLIKIIAGTYGHNVNGTVVPRTAADKPFELADDKAQRLIRLKVAQPAGEGVPAEVAAEIVADNLEDMSLAELKEIAAARGKDVSALRKKADVIEVLREDLAESEDEDDEDGDDAPQLGPAALV